MVHSHRPEKFFNLRKYTSLSVFAHTKPKYLRKNEITQLIILLLYHVLYVHVFMVAQYITIYVMTLKKNPTYSVEYIT